MSSSKNKSSEETSRSSMEFGRYLRDARISAGLDIRKISKKLHLTKDVVEALEEFNFNDLPARVFVRGYVFNYARHVGLQVELTMEKFDEFWPENRKDSEINSLPKLSYDPNTINRWSNLIKLSLALLILVILAIFFIRYESEEIQNDKVSNIISGNENTSYSDIKIPNENLASLVKLKKKLKKSEVGIHNQLASSDLAINSKVSKNDNSLVIKFYEDCWVDIKGTNESYRLLGIMKAGTVRNIDGIFPYEVVLGNASEVEVIVNGDIYKFDNFIDKENVARFTVSL